MYDLFQNVLAPVKMCIRDSVIFKGTEKRKAYHILSRLEDVGGELNAYTTKEDTCVYATFMAKDYERALELFADIVFHSVFPEKEIEKEKDVVLDEINSYKDNPGELIFDDFEELIYTGSVSYTHLYADTTFIHKVFLFEQVLRVRPAYSMFGEQD